jgi:radical SAM superfamily enzyme
MSISISIGSSIQDLEKLQQTKDIISFVSNLLKSEDQEVIFANKTYTYSQINNLSKWYDDILNILYNAGTPEDFVPQLTH